MGTKALRRNETHSQVLNLELSEHQEHGDELVRGSHVQRTTMRFSSNTAVREQGTVPSKCGEMPAGLDSRSRPGLAPCEEKRVFGHGDLAFYTLFAQDCTDQQLHQNEE